ncbi:ATP-binding protein [candidate division KSB1 bacterium]
MKREIIKIDESLCDGCGDCITSCSEGALEIIDGKAKLVKETYCDGFGDCIGTCPTGALSVEEREADQFSVEATKEHLLHNHGMKAVRQFEEAHNRHQGAAHEHNGHSGCPGAAMRNVQGTEKSQPVSSDALPVVNSTELRQWPIQIHLVPPGAPFFRDKELVVMNTCGPLASADVHWRYLRGRGVVVGCPKLDHTEPYPGKIAAILGEQSIPKVIVVRMEVPCCGGLTQIVQEAINLSGRTDIVFQEDTINIDGSITSRILYEPSASKGDAVLQQASRAV